LPAQKEISPGTYIARYTKSAPSSPSEIKFERLVESQRDFHLSASRSLQKIITSRRSDIAKAVILARENRSVCPKIISYAASLSANIILAGSAVVIHEKSARPIIEKREMR